jgi:hypothetical protein
MAVLIFTMNYNKISNPYVSFIDFLSDIVCADELALCVSNKCIIPLVVFVRFLMYLQ